MVELHRIDGATTVFVVLRVWAEHGRKQDPSPDAFGVRFVHSCRQIEEEQYLEA
jgi:hypothetical protein